METGGIRTRDKRYEAGESVRQHKKTIRHFADVRVKGHYLGLHLDRVEYHRQRVAGDERFMREHNINPNVRGSAIKFDQLMERVK